MIFLPDRAPRLDVDQVLRTDPNRWARHAREIGASREGRPILGLTAGSGSTRVTLIGGCHADEPVGPAVLERLAGHLVELSAGHPLLRGFEWRIVPHVNPDGEDRNRAWTERRGPTCDHLGQADEGYELDSYLTSAVRELPGDDIEFGFPSGDVADARTIRPENRAVADFLAAGTSAKSAWLHGSFHGMGLAPGPWFLLEPSWTERTALLRRHLTRAVDAMGYRLFDAERHGEKGFHRIEPGFATRPDSRAMRAFFEARGEPEEAARFRPSSMEFVRAMGACDPLTFVTEMPLFLTPTIPLGPVDRKDLEAVGRRLQEAAIQGPAALEAVATELGIAPMPIRDQMRLQLALLGEALRTVSVGNGVRPGA